MERNALVKAYQDKPVKFLAVMANSTLFEASAYQIKNGLRMPIFAEARASLAEAAPSQSRLAWS